MNKQLQAMLFVTKGKEKEMGFVVTQDLVKKLKDGLYDAKLKDIYVDEKKISYERNRYIKAVESYTVQFGEGEVSVFSAPGRSEIGGNHTDHQCGEVLAASINNDAIAIVQKLKEPCVKVISDGYELITIDLDDLDRREDEAVTTNALIRGVLAKTKEYGYQIGGFQAFVTSDVLIGAGLSSSAAFETLMGTILSYLFNDGKISPIEIAMIGQFAENVYFGKPSGLMDQMASSVGGFITIDFADEKHPVIDSVKFDFTKSGHALCIVDTKGNHADLTPEYAAIPAEMKSVAAFFGKKVLREITKEQLLENICAVREKCSDRAVLRALHFFDDNERVGKEASALSEGDFDAFLSLINESGDSSFKYLQNIYASSAPNEQGLSLALYLAKQALGGEGACRVHGGGFAGTIQAFVPEKKLEAFKAEMERVFGEGSCYVLSIRPVGGVQIDL